MRNFALMWVLAACLLGCGGDKDAKDKAVSAVDTVATFTDTRDGQVYKIVEIGSQKWFAENLNYAAEGSRCYEDSPDSCAKYGRLYDWETALKVCPVGTHLSSDEEWTTLENYGGGDSIAGKKLKSTSGWNDYGKGTDEYGFSTLPGGFYDDRKGFCCVDHISSAVFFDAGICGYWWSATELNVWKAWSRTMCNNYNDKYVDGVDGCGNYKTRLFSVRCVLDDEKEGRK